MWLPLTGPLMLPATVIRCGAGAPAPAGNLVGLLLSPLILQRFGWRALFYLFGVAGAPLLLLWMLVVPGRAPAGGGGGAGGAGGIGLGQLMSKPATWAIIVANFGVRACRPACTSAMPLAVHRSLLAARYLTCQSPAVCHRTGCPLAPSRHLCCITPRPTPHACPRLPCSQPLGLLHLPQLDAHLLLQSAGWVPWLPSMLLCVVARSRSAMLPVNLAA